MEVDNQTDFCSFEIEGQGFRMVMDYHTHRWEIYKGKWNWKQKPIFTMSKAKGRSFLNTLEMIKKSCPESKKPSRSSQKGVE